MATKAKAPARPRPAGSGSRSILSPAPSQPRTTEERLQCIQAMSERLKGYVEFMCQVATMNGTSAEARDRAVTAFYEQMVTLEKQLGRIQEEFRLE